jgi:hypothetical protein
VEKYKWLLKIFIALDQPNILKMLLNKYFLRILTVLILFMASCHFDTKNPFTKEEITFNVPEQEVIKNLHKEFQFDSVNFSGVSFDLMTNGGISTTHGKRINLQVSVLNPKIDKNELAFAQEFARAIKPYVKNIDHFNVITVDTKIQTKHTGWSEEQNRKTLLYAGSLLEFPIENYFITIPDHN